MLAQLIAVALGIWLMVAPAIVETTRNASNLERIIGPLVATFGAIAAAQHLRSVRFWNLPLSIVLGVSPIVISYGSTIAAWNALLTACAIAVCSLRKGRITHRYGGGWRELLSSSR
jgi:hypothetical protein